MLEFKKLETHYTTEEQAKRLIRIGLPANSADLYTDEDGVIHFINDDNLFREDFFEHYGKYNGYEPRWTDGRLLEIYGRVTHLMAPELGTIGITEDIVAEILKKSRQGCDFSKIEEL